MILEKNRSLFHNIKDSEIFSVKSTSYFLSLERRMFSRRSETFFFSLNYTIILEAYKLWDMETNLVSISVTTTNKIGLAFAWVELCRGPLLKHRITIPRSV